MNPVELQEYPGVLLVPFTASKDQKVYFVVKRLFDIIVGLVGVLFLIPLSIIIKISFILTGDFASIFFVQNRIGKRGKRIKIYKFRSMVPYSEQILEEMMAKDPKVRDEYLKNKKLENDPRITKVGHVIRKFSIDEFPQFINVLKGEMSLIGPRPYLFREKEDMGEFYDFVIKCKPGITGLWQVSGRSNVAFEKRLLLDKLYYLERSLLFDLDICLKTFGAVIFHRGAK